jgi:hypothetical protein
VKSGNQKAIAGLYLFVGLLVTVNAGRESENGTGMWWIAPELVETKAGALAETCSQPVSKVRELVFETLDPADIDELPRHLSVGAREVVDFDWNPATSELRFSTTAPTSVFSDLAMYSDANDPSDRNCGSR